MSEARNDFGRKSITPKTKKLHPRVDLTAMVSVSFLLIVFFMLTSFLARNNAMEYETPDDGRNTCGPEIGCISDDRVYTILLGKNKMVCYEGGEYDFSDKPIDFKFNNDDLIGKLISKNEYVQKINGDPKKGLIVFVKSSKQSTYGNLVNVLDKLAIARTPTYAVVDITPEEEALLASK